MCFRYVLIFCRVFRVPRHDFYMTSLAVLRLVSYRTRNARNKLYAVPGSLQLSKISMKILAVFASFLGFR